MKKREIYILSSWIYSTLFIFCLHMSAGAQFKSGGMVTLDMFYHFQDRNRVKFNDFKYTIIVDTIIQSNTTYYANDTINPVFEETDKLDLMFSIPFFYNRFWMSFNLQQFEAYLQIRAGSRKWAKIKDAEYIGEIFHIAEAWLKWKPAPAWELTFGRQTTGFSRLLPKTRLGRDARDSKDYNFGDLVAQHQLSALRLDYSILPNLTAGLFLIDPDAELSGEAIRHYPGGYESITKKNLVPRIDLFLNYQISPKISLEPSLTWSYQKYDIGEVPNSDDDFHIYGLALSAQATAGFFTFLGEAHWGQNLGNGNYSGAEWEGKVETHQSITPGGTANKLSNANIRSGWANLGVTFSQFDILGLFGVHHAVNEDIPTDKNDDHSVTMWMAGISIPIKVLDALTITPEFMYYSFGREYKKGDIKNVKYYSVPNDKRSEFIRIPHQKIIDRGYEYVAGIQIGMVF